MKINRTFNTSHITIGANPILTRNILVMLHNRRVRETRAALRKKKLSQFCRNALDALRFWK